MEGISVRFNDIELWDKVLKNCLPEAGDLMMVTKDNCTASGRPGVMLTFTVELPNGEMRRAQTVVTGRLFALMAAAFRGRYGPEGDAVRTADKVN